MVDKVKIHRIKKWMIRGVMFAVLMIVIAISINLYMLNRYKNQYLHEDMREGVKVDCIMVLGAGVWSNQRPSPMLTDRLEVGIELYNEGLSNRLLMSGDHGQIDYDEVNVMKDYAIQQAVPSGHIFMDHAGFSTYESMVRAKEVFQVKSMIIVTQGYHLPRALYIANSIGIEAYGVDADLRQYYGQKKYDRRENIARIKDFFYVLIGVNPTYLGDTIPIDGSGDATDDH